MLKDKAFNEPLHFELNLTSQFYCQVEAEVLCVFALETHLNSSHKSKI